MPPLAAGTVKASIGVPAVQLRAGTEVVAPNAGTVSACTVQSTVSVSVSPSRSVTVTVAVPEPVRVGVPATSRSADILRPVGRPEAE